MNSSDTWNIVWRKYPKTDKHPKLVNLVKKYSPGKKILEVGFGSAGDLNILSTFGYDCYGLEKSKVAYKLAKKNKKLNIFLGDGRNSPFPNNYFDLIFHQGLLEHFKNPKQLLIDHLRILKKNGVVIIDVPHKWNIFTLYKKYFLIKGTWYGGWERSFSAEDLKNLFDKYGFDSFKIVYRGIFPHQWRKFLYPENISRKKILKNILTKTPVKYFQLFIKNIYKRNKFLQTVSSYNIIIVARKK